MPKNIKLQDLKILSAMLALSFGLAACGGGNGGDAPAVSAAAGAGVSDLVALLHVPVAASSTAVVTNTTPAPAPAPVLTSDHSCGLNGPAGIEAELLQRINALRRSGAVCGTTGFAATGPLVWNNLLLVAAKGHSKDMAQKNYFAHTSQDGRSPGQRVTSTGYNWTIVGENIAAEQSSVERVVSRWTNSPGHCQNLMNPSFRDVAVACVRSDTSTYRFYWTMNLGRSR